MPFRTLKLEEVKLTKKEEEMLIDMMSNLPKLNDVLKDEDLCDISVVRKMLAVELRTKKRPATISRLAGRFKTLLAIEVDQEVYEGA